MRFLIFLLGLFTPLFLNAQAPQALIDGYVFESGNRGYLNQVQISLLDGKSGEELMQLYSDLNGHFEIPIDANTSYQLLFRKELFHDLILDLVSTESKNFVKAKMERAPGYIFEITLADKRADENIQVDAIRGALIEVYNNTTKEEVLVLEDHPHPDFNVHLTKGNHYTILVRKKGYIAKRMEAFVDVEGCILCFEGLGRVEPGVSDNLTEGNEMGTLLANVEMERLYKGKKLEIKNLYYAFNKADINPDAAKELDKAIIFLKDNPHLSVVLGSHTDARGDDDSNQRLSERRAKSAVAYLVQRGNIDKSRISHKGFGESQIINHCENGVSCSDAEHKENRRTELEITGIEEHEIRKSLLQLKREEQMEALIEELSNQKAVRVEEGEELPDEIKEDIDTSDAAIIDVAPEKVEEIDTVLEETVEKAGSVTREEVGEKELENKSKKNLEDLSDAVYVRTIEGDELPKVPSQEPEIEPIEEVVTKAISPDFSNSFAVSDGYKIVIHFTNHPLAEDHEIFQKHHRVEHYITKNRNILYLIGQFESEKDATNFLKMAVAQEYPSAYVAQFENGKRIRG